MLGPKGSAWPLYPSIPLCMPVSGSWAASELYHFRPANTPSPITDSRSSPSLLEMPAPEGSPSGPSPHLQSPTSVQRMPPPCVVRSRSTPLPICLLYSPACPGVANALSPCCLGQEGRPQSQWRLTIARWTANVAQDAWCSSLHHPVSGRSRGQKWISPSL